MAYAFAAISLLHPAGAAADVSPASSTVPACSNVWSCASTIPSPQSTTPSTQSTTAEEGENATMIAWILVLLVVAIIPLLLAQRINSRSDAG
jgi:hypothetical protein